VLREEEENDKKQQKHTTLTSTPGINAMVYSCVSLQHMNTIFNQSIGQSIE